MNGFVIDVAAELRMLEQRHELGTKNEIAAGLRVQQRLLADAIAREEQRLVALVPNGESEHAAQVFGAIDAILVVSVHDGLSVAVGIEPVTTAFEFLAQLAIVVDFAVENDPPRLVGIVNRLLAAFQIDDGESTHRETDTIVEIKAVFVRTAMMDRRVHLREQIAIDGRAITTNDACNSAHYCSGVATCNELCLLIAKA